MYGFSTPHFFLGAFSNQQHRNSHTEALSENHTEIIGHSGVGYENDERVRALDHCIAHLDPLNRALLLLYLEERSYREIADILGISETNVATKINRLKQRIRQQMASTDLP